MHLGQQLIPRALGLAPNGRSQDLPPDPKNIGPIPSQLFPQRELQSLRLFCLTVAVCCLLPTRLSLSVHVRIRETQRLCLPRVGHSLGEKAAEWLCA